MEEDLWSKSYPMLAAFLFDVRYDSGKQRETCSMSVGEIDGMVRVYLNDKNTELSACLVAKTPTALWKALCAGLDGDNLPWVRQKQSAKGRSRKR